MTTAKDIWNANEAKEIAVIAKNATTGDAKILIFGLQGDVALDLDKGLARALALRLADLALEMSD